MNLLRTPSSEESFLQDFLQILKCSLQNLGEKCFLVIGSNKSLNCLHTEIVMTNLMVIYYWPTNFYWENISLRFSRNSEAFLKNLDIFLYYRMIYESSSIFTTLYCVLLYWKGSRILNLRLSLLRHTVFLTQRTLLDHNTYNNKKNLHKFPVGPRKSCVQQCSQMLDLAKEYWRGSNTISGVSGVSGVIIKISAWLLTVGICTRLYNGNTPCRGIFWFFLWTGSSRKTIVFLTKLYLWKLTVFIFFFINFVFC